MILAVFGTVYAVCLAILAVTLLKAKPLPSGRSVRAGHAPGSEVSGAREPTARELVATHH